MLVKGGTIVTAADTYVADVLVVDEKVQVIGRDLGTDAERVIDARGKYVLPGAIDVHTHLDMPFDGAVSTDDFLTGTNGIFVNPPGYLTTLRALCDKYGILLVSDAVMSGFGRTGRWWAVDHQNVVPDIITFAKGVNSGYVPLGGMILSQKLSDYFTDHMFWGGLTYSGHPLACAAGIANMQVYEEEGLIENAARMGDLLLSEMRKVQARHPSVGDVRGQGLFVGVELVKDKATREPITSWNSAGSGISAELGKALMAQGIFVYCRWNVMFLAPPLIINEEQIRLGVRLMDQTLAVADAAAN